MGLIGSFLRKNKSGKRSQVKSHSRKKKALILGRAGVGLLGLGVSGLLVQKGLKNKKLLSKAIDNKNAITKTKDLRDSLKDSTSMTTSRTFRPEDISNSGKATPIYRRLPSDVERFAIDKPFRDYRFNKTLQQINQLYRQGLERDQIARANRGAKKAIKKLKGSK